MKRKCAIEVKPRKKSKPSIDVMEMWGYVASFADQTTFRSILRLSKVHYAYNWKPWMVKLWFWVHNWVTRKSRIDYVSRVVCFSPKVSDSQISRFVNTGAYPCIGLEGERRIIPHFFGPFGIFIFKEKWYPESGDMPYPENIYDIISAFEYVVLIFPWKIDFEHRFLTSRSLKMLITVNWQPNYEDKNYLIEICRHRVEKGAFVHSISPYLGSQPQIRDPRDSSKYISPKWIYNHIIKCLDVEPRQPQ